MTIKAWQLYVLYCVLFCHVAMSKTIVQLAPTSGMRFDCVAHITVHYYPDLVTVVTYVK